MFWDWTLANAGTVALFGAGISAFIGAIWKISKAEYNILARITLVEHENIAEKLKLKQDILETKLDAADKYIHKDSFEVAMRNLDSRLIRLESKLDKILERK